MWPNPQDTFIEEILNGNLHFLCSDPIEKLLRLTKIKFGKKSLTALGTKI